MATDYLQHASAVALARYADQAWITQLADLGPERRIATLTAYTHVLASSARDDVIDIFDVVFGDMQRAATHRGQKRRAGELRDYDAAVAAVHARLRCLLDALDDDPALAGVLEQLRTGRAGIEQNMGTMQALMRPPADPFHERLVAAYPQISRFLPRLIEALELTPLDADPEPASLATLRAHVEALLPEVEIADLPLEVHGWTGFLDGYTHISGTGIREEGLTETLSALLVSESCNVGLTPVADETRPTLSRARLNWVAHNYLRSATHAAANTRLVDYHTPLPLAQAWGGGEMASAGSLSCWYDQENTAVTRAGPGSLVFMLTGIRSAGTSKASRNPRTASAGGPRPADERAAHLIYPDKREGPSPGDQPTDADHRPRGDLAPLRLR